MMKQTLEEPTPPSEKVAQNPVLLPPPPAVDEAIAWMMNKDPAARPPSLAEAMTALEQAAGLEPIPRASDPNIRTGPLRLTPTPGRLTPIPRSRSTPAHGTTALAQTMAATDEQIASARAASAGEHASANTLPPARRSRLPLILGALIVAVAAVAGIVVMQGSNEKPSSKVAAEPAPVAASQPAPAPAIEKPTPPAPQFATITITGVPEHTEVYGPQGPLGFAPGKIQLVRGSDEVQLVIRAEGFVDKQIAVAPDADKPLAVELEPKAEPSKPVAVKKPRPVVTKPATPKPAPPKPPGQGTQTTTPVDDPYARH
jgi:hypothetical protein